MASVYWIHHPEHTDMFTQGYIGITKNIAKRFEEHKNRPSNTHLKNAINKYGWDNLVKEVILVADKAYCLMIEAKLRTKEQIGWNVNKGGGFLPEIPWNKGIKLNKEQKAKQFSLAKFVKQHGAWNKGKKMSYECIQKLVKANTGKKVSDSTKLKMSIINTGRVFEKITCPHCNTIGGATTMKRWHFDKCTGSKKFNARTTINGKRIFIGNFATKELANLAIENYKKENS